MTRPVDVPSHPADLRQRDLPNPLTFIVLGDSVNHLRVVRVGCIERIDEYPAPRRCINDGVVRVWYAQSPRPQKFLLKRHVSVRWRITLAIAAADWAAGTAAATNATVRYRRRFRLLGLDARTIPSFEP
jgi:hypothetical protein